MKAVGGTEDSARQSEGKGDGRSLELRREFDSAFAAPRAVRSSDVEKLVVLQVGSLWVACRVLEVTRFESLRRVVPLSNGAPGLIGIAGLRGKVVPVFGLAAILGIGGAEGTPWVAICGEADPIGLAFDRLDRFVTVRRSDVSAVGDGNRLSSHTNGLLRIGSVAHDVLDLPAVLSAIRGATGADARRA